MPRQRSTINTPHDAAFIAATPHRRGELIDAIRAYLVDPGLAEEHIQRLRLRGGAAKRKALFASNDRKYRIVSDHNTACAWLDKLEAADPATYPAGLYEIHLAEAKVRVAQTKAAQDQELGQ